MFGSATLLGSSSGRNTGDAALISSIMQAVNTSCQNSLLYEIPTIRPGYIRDNYREKAKPIGMLPWNFSIKMLGIPTYRSIMRTDLTLIFDAILFDRSLYNPLFNFMSTLYLLLPLAKKKGKKMGFYNVGTGPVSTPTGRKMLKELAELMDFVSVRDQDSMDILKDIGVRNQRMFIAADAAINAPSSDDTRVREIFTKTGINPDKEILAVNINVYLDTWAQTGKSSIGEGKFLSTYAGTLNKVMRSIDAQLLFITTQHADTDITRKLIARLDPGITASLIPNTEYNHYDMKGVLRNVNLLFGMRLHSMILASSELTPVVGLAYQPKVHHYFSTIGLREYSLGFEDFSEDSLVRHILTGWEKRSIIKSHLQQSIPPLREKANKPAELVAALNSGEDMDTAFARVQK
ncbi:MAG: polysaccharide pyruvyl transferase family protein [Kiritimatiellae bacterium]|nr:polysaccharide pyruvyl transferase family protein [Kiritimatiellia bacterium]MDD5522661.1 polysaccharide pyruvyl transferase family protein [Kiritimatiellia bacterium]